MQTDTHETPEDRPVRSSETRNAVAIGIVALVVLAALAILFYPVGTFALIAIVLLGAPVAYFMFRRRREHGRLESDGREERLQDKSGYTVERHPVEDPVR